MDDSHRDPRAVELEQEFPRWSIWVSDTGYWWASLRKDPTAAQRRAGCLSYLRARNDSELADLLHEQEQIASNAGVLA